MSNPTAAKQRSALIKLEDNQLWQDAQKIAETVYGIYDQLSDDDKIALLWKFRNRAFDLTSDIAEACGAITPKEVEYSLSAARRSLFGIKNSYKYLVMQDILTIDPAFMVKLNELADAIDAQVKVTWQNLDEAEEQDFKK